MTGTTTPPYTIQDRDSGFTIELKEIAYTAAPRRSRCISDPTAVVPPPPPVNASAPTISGTVEQDQTLTATPGSWTNSPDPSGYTYQWEDCDALGGCADIPGAGQATYKLTANDVGDAIVVRVQASNSSGAGAAATSSPTGPTQTTSTVVAEHRARRR